MNPLSDSDTPVFRKDAAVVGSRPSNGQGPDADQASAVDGVITDPEGATLVGGRPSPPVTLRVQGRPGRGPGVWVTTFLVLLVFAAGALLVHDGLVLLLDGRGDPWLGRALRRVALVAPTDAVLGVGIALVFVGLFLVIAGVRPRRRRAFAVRAGTGITLERRDVAQVAATAARSVDGVTSSQATVSRRSIVVRVSAAARTAPVDEIDSAVAEALRHLDGLPRLAVSRQDDRRTRRVL